MAKKPRANIVVRFAFVCAVLFLVFSVVNMQFKLRELRNEKSKAEEKLSEIADVVQETQQRLNTPLTNEYYERVAREKYGYCNPNEIVFYNNLAD